MWFPDAIFLEYPIQRRPSNGEMMTLLDHLFSVADVEVVVGTIRSAQEHGFLNHARECAIGRWTPCVAMYQRGDTGLHKCIFHTPDLSDRQIQEACGLAGGQDAGGQAFDHPDPALLFVAQCYCSHTHTLPDILPEQVTRTFSLSSYSVVYNTSLLSDRMEIVVL